MTVDAISFNGVQRTTKAGNEYTKTRANKVAGTLIGGSAAGYMAYMANKTLKNPEMFNAARKGAQKLLKKTNIQEFKNVELGTLESIKALKVGTGMMAAAAVAIGLGVGAVVDACVNKHRKNKADKAAQV